MSFSPETPSDDRIGTPIDTDSNSFQEIVEVLRSPFVEADFGPLSKEEELRMQKDFQSFLGPLVKKPVSLDALKALDVVSKKAESLMASLPESIADMNFLDIFKKNHDDTLDDAARQWVQALIANGSEKISRAASVMSDSSA